MQRTEPRGSTRTRARKLLAWGYLSVVNGAPLAAVATGTRAADWIAFALLYLSASFAVGIGLHRYFSHRAFKTGRTFQLVMGILGCTTFTDPIAFAGKHRIHHRHSDTGLDVHSPRQGFWHCWLGSIVDEGCTPRELEEAARDWTKFPELVWMQEYFCVPGVALGILTYAIGGFSMFAIGFCLSRALVMHAASMVNFFCHGYGRRRFETRDLSTNNAAVALLTFGEGWHNNHHRYPSSARAGFAWWEVDMLYWLLKLLARLGIVWDLREAPAARKACAADDGGEVSRAGAPG